MNQSKKEIKYSNLSAEDKKQIEKEKLTKSIIGIILGSTIYAIGIVWILRLGGFFSSGVTGASQLIVSLVEKFCTNEAIVEFMSTNMGTLVLLINVPLFVFGWKTVSKKFALLTVLALVIQSTLLNILSKYTVSPFIYLLMNGEQYAELIHNPAIGSHLGIGIIDAIRTGSINLVRTAETIEIQQLFQVTMLPGTRFLLAICGGFVTGLGVAICLRSGGSTGGMDIITNYFVVKKHKSFTGIQTVVDVIVISSSVLINVESVIYTLIRLAIYMKVIDSVYKIYKTNRIEIVTTKADEIKDALFKSFYHGMTIYDCVGGFTNEAKKTIVVYASNYEVRLYSKIVKEIDPHAFITVIKASIDHSNYVQKTIV